MKQTLRKTLSLIKSDVKARAELEEKQLTPFRITRLLFKSASFPVVVYRWQVFFYQNHMGLIASLLKFFNNVIFAVIIDSEAEIGPGFLFYHTHCIFIGPNVRIGKNCHLVHQNTIMATPFYHPDASRTAKGPTIGDGLLLGCGACVIGDIVLGNNVKVSINSTVDESFPDDAVLIGVPARNLAKSSAD